MADWCKEKYEVTFNESDRRESPLEDPLYKASKMVTAWLDLDEPQYASGVPLGAVMDTLGFSEGRSGIRESSVITDVTVGGDTLSFVVKDNFSSFDPVQLLADKLGVDLKVVVSRVFSDAPGLVREYGDEYSVRCRKGLEEQFSTMMSYGLLDFGGERGFIPVVPPEVGELALPGFDVVSFGPEPDSFLVRRNMPASSEFDTGVEEDPYVKMKVGELPNSEFLENVLGVLNSTLCYWEEESMKVEDGQMNVRTATDAESVRSWLDNVRGKLYGTASYDKLSGFMQGFDVTFERFLKKELTEEDALEIARHAVTADGGETDLSEEVQHVLGDMSPEEALREWDVEIPDSYCDDILRLSYDGDVMMEFTVKPDNLWPVRDVDWDLVNYFTEKTGVSLDRKFGFGADYPGTEGSVVMDVCGESLLSPENRRCVADAVRRAARHDRKVDTLRRFKELERSALKIR